MSQHSIRVLLLAGWIVMGTSRAAPACRWCRVYCCPPPVVVYCSPYGYPSSRTPSAGGNQAENVGPGREAAESPTPLPSLPSTAVREGGEPSRARLSFGPSPMPPLPENTEVPAGNPMPTPSPRDEPLGNPLPPAAGSGPGPAPAIPVDGPGPGAPAGAVESAPPPTNSFPTFEAPGPITIPLPDEPQRSDVIPFPDEFQFDVPDGTPQPQPVEPAENPFDGARSNGLPTLLPGGLNSRQLRRWAVDGAGQRGLRARLAAVSNDGARLVRLVKEDGSVAVIPLDRLSRRDVSFVALQLRAAGSANALTAAKEFDHAPGGVLATLDARSDADAAIRVARQR